MLRGGRKKGRCRGKESGSGVCVCVCGGGGCGGVGDACAITREYPLVHHYTGSGPLSFRMTILAIMMVLRQITDVPCTHYDRAGLATDTHRAMIVVIHKHTQL